MKASYYPLLVLAIVAGGTLATYAIASALRDPLAVVLATLGVLVVGAFAFYRAFGPRPRPRRFRRDEHANTTALSLLVIAVATVAFQSLLFGGALLERSIITTLPLNECEYEDDGKFWTVGDGALALIACYIGNFFKFTANIFIVIASVVAFFFNALTFNIPGAPLTVRVVVGTVFVGGVGFAIAAIMRGTSA